ncbi:MAG: ABC transporter substrate-binding protein [Chloroflexi bacterium]|nr:ABC transporter substrate-binding protein [Chloroflexota bacterium]
MLNLTKVCTVVALALSLTACDVAGVTAPPSPSSSAAAAPSSSPSQNSPASAASSAAPASSGASASTAPGVTKVTFWHAMTGTNGDALNKMVANFNASRKDIQVEAVFQGSYDDALNKFRQSMQTNTLPDLIQVYDIGSRFMIDSKAIKPMQDFIDAEKYDTGDFEPNVLKYYSLNGKLNSMPFNTSTPLLYYYKDMFRAAGLDPEKPPATFQELADDARKLTKKDASGQTSQYGAGWYVYGWFMEQFLANQNALFVNNGNGRQAPATEAAFNSPVAQNTLNFWKQGLQEGWFLNTGRVSGDADNAFKGGKMAMTLQSTATLRSYLNATPDNHHELGTGMLPRDASAEKGGVIIGGASLWTLKNHPDAELKAAWEFVKFLSSPEQQAFWHIQTGYFPIRKSAYDVQADKDWVAQYPQFKTAIDQLHAAPDGAAEQGAVIGVFPQARQSMENAIESAILNKQPVKEALDASAKEVTSAIVQYNKTAGL